MKTLKLFFKIYLVSFYTGLVLFSCLSCNESYLEETIASDTLRAESVQLNNILSYLEYDSDIIIVQKDHSVQEAVNVSQPGDIIFIEPGIYKEELTINKPGIKLIGACCTANEMVIIENPGDNKNSLTIVQDGNPVEFINIQFLGFVNDGDFVPGYKSTYQSRKRMFCGMKHEELGNGIVHYQFDFKVGPDEYDVIRLRRVVKESRPKHPVRTRGDIFLVHGAPQDFDDIFLTAGATVINAETSVAYYLAERDIDVWGIDLAWNFIPTDLADYSFMKDWSISKDSDHTSIALTIARLIRGTTRQGFQRMNLLGFSYGVLVAYDLAGRETQQYPIFRDIKGLIPVDHTLKYNPENKNEYEELRLNNCAIAADYKQRISEGIYFSDDGAMFNFLGNLALTMPDEMSPVPDFEVLGFTNKMVMHFLGTNTYALGFPYAPFWHFFGGDLENLYYTDPTRFFRLATVVPPYHPALSEYHASACMCEETDVSIDDFLEEIQLPILYIGAGGGLGNRGSYTSALTASSDITNMLITKGVDPATDYGHGDLFMARDADEMVWKDLYNWLINHSSR